MTNLSPKPYARLDWRGFLQFFATLGEAKKLTGGGAVIWYQGGVIWTQKGRGGGWISQPAQYVKVEEWENLK